MVKFSFLIYRLARNIAYEKFDSGETIFRIGDKPENFYMLLKGNVNIFKIIHFYKEMTCESYIESLFKLKEEKEFFILKKILLINNLILNIKYENIEKLYEAIIRKRLANFLKTEPKYNDIKEFLKRYNKIPSDYNLDSTEIKSLFNLNTNPKKNSIIINNERIDVLNNIKNKSNYFKILKKIESSDSENEKEEKPELDIFTLIQKINLDLENIETKIFPNQVTEKGISDDNSQINLENKSDLTIKMKNANIEEYETNNNKNDNDNSKNINDQNKDSCNSLPPQHLKFKLKDEKKIEQKQNYLMQIFNIDINTYNKKFLIESYVNREILKNDLISDESKILLCIEEVKVFGLYKYEVFHSLSEGHYFGDYALESNILRTATIKADNEETHLAVINKKLYYEFIYEEKLRLTAIFHDFIYNSLFVHFVKKKDFEKKYFGNFIYEEYSKNQILLKENEPMNYIYFIFEGSLVLYSRKSYFDINSDIERISSLNSDVKKEINGIYKPIITLERMNSYQYKINFFTDKLKYKKNSVIKVISKKEVFGLENMEYGLPSYYTGMVNSNKLCFFKIHKKIFQKILAVENEKGSLIVKDLIKTKLVSLIHRLYEIKRSFIDILKIHDPKNHVLKTLHKELNLTREEINHNKSVYSSKKESALDNKTTNNHDNPNKEELSAREFTPQYFDIDSDIENEVPGFYKNINTSEKSEKRRDKILKTDKEIIQTSVKSRKAYMKLSVGCERNYHSSKYVYKKLSFENTSLNPYIFNDNIEKENSGNTIRSIMKRNDNIDNKHNSLKSKLRRFVTIKENDNYSDKENKLNLANLQVYQAKDKSIKSKYRDTRKTEKKYMSLIKNLEIQQEDFKKKNKENIIEIHNSESLLPSNHALINLKSNQIYNSESVITPQSIHNYSKSNIVTNVVLLNDYKNKNINDKIEQAVKINKNPTSILNRKENYKLKEENKNSSIFLTTANIKSIRPTFSSNEFLTINKFQKDDRDKILHNNQSEKKIIKSISGQNKQNIYTCKTQDYDIIDIDNYREIYGKLKNNPESVSNALKNASFANYNISKKENIRYNNQEVSSNNIEKQPKRFSNNIFVRNFNNRMLHYIKDKINLEKIKQILFKNKYTIKNQDHKLYSFKKNMCKLKNNFFENDHKNYSDSNRCQENITNYKFVSSQNLISKNNNQERQKSLKLEAFEKLFFSEKNNKSISSCKIKDPKFDSFVCKQTFKTDRAKSNVGNTQYSGFMVIKDEKHHSSDSHIFYDSFSNINPQDINHIEMMNTLVECKNNNKKFVNDKNKNSVITKKTIHETAKTSNSKQNKINTSDHTIAKKVLRGESEVNSRIIYRKNSHNKMENQFYIGNINATFLNFIDDRYVNLNDLLEKFSETSKYDELKLLIENLKKKSQNSNLIKSKNSIILKKSKKSYSLGKICDTICNQENLYDGNNSVFPMRKNKVLKGMKFFNKYGKK